MGMPSGPKLPGPTLADIGKGRRPWPRHASVLEERSGDVWRSVSRYGSVQEAGAALDELVADGRRPDQLRVSEIGWTQTQRIATGIVLGLLSLVLVVAIFLLLIPS
jgi:hypothetical protein